MAPGSDTPDRTVGSDSALDADEVDQQRPVAPETARALASDDPGAPEGDVLDQGTEVAPGERAVEPAVAERAWREEANEADVWEQSLEVPLDEDDRR